MEIVYTMVLGAIFWLVLSVVAHLVVGLNTKVKLMRFNLKELREKDAALDELLEDTKRLKAVIEARISQVGGQIH